MTTKKKKPPVTESDKRVRQLEAQLRQLESIRSDQVEELLNKQQEMMSDIAELLTRCIRV